MTTSTTIDNAAVLWSATGADRADRPLLLIMHGYGSHEGDLFSLAPHLPLEPVIAALRAPLVAPAPVTDGWAWFPISEPGSPDPATVAAAVTAVLDWLDALPQQPPTIGLLGFSQGGAMALELLRAAPDRFSFAVNLSGFIATGSQFSDAELAERPAPVFWGRGTADGIIPTSAIERTQAWLPNHSTLTERIYEGLAHSISQAELGDVVNFLRAQYVTVAAEPTA
ncbi:alpha/beta hydrolase [Cryobacterium luteum]|uniref:Alpha/beta fold hydrolase n=1 Tax=Cryobacterium luteum TaxID=1424661 RepID=A0A1H8BWA5_9MICO|nr:alpha/beta fold hydrolase [Cryobacterium luteum]TFB89159.1 alpha/beta fold hydrolase [Cryobacterium luteum]SEM87175.1 phospholipase/carboxylesterase [Cryobacterium luteum]